MNNLGSNECETTRDYLDSYIGNELLVETTHEVLHHLERCAACAAELETRTRLRSRLKAAVTAQSVPADLPLRVRAKLRKPGRSPQSWAAFGWGGWAAGAVALAGVVLAASLWLTPPHDPLPPLGDRPRQNAFIERISASLAQVLQLGLGDHVHCTIFRDHTKKPPSLEQMEADLGPAFKELLSAVRSGIPEGFRVVMAHHCSYRGRPFTHLTMQKGAELLSLVIAEKRPGESLAELAPAARSSGIPIYQSGAERYQVAGFEAGRFFAFVVSELRAGRNLEIAGNLAPSVQQVLLKIQA